MADPGVALTALVVTYNHAQYVEQALASVIDQETTFEFEIVIAEDCSTDGTRELVEQFARAHPDRVRLSLSEANINTNAVVRRGIEMARGRYLALLDGDDFWTSPQKLQCQFDYLEAHPECALCFHNADVVYEDGATATHRFHEEVPMSRLAKPKPQPVSGLVDIVRRDFVPTCSAVMRTDALRPLPDWYDDIWSGDWPLYILCAQQGALGYLDTVMATYRIHPAGLWTSNISLYRTIEDVETIASVYETIDAHLGRAYHAEIAEELARLYEGVAVGFYRRGEVDMARICARRAFGHWSGLRRLVRWRIPAVLVLTTARGVRRRAGSSSAGS